MVTVVVLARPYAWLFVWMGLGQDSDVDEEAGPGIDPAGIDHVHRISPISVRRMGADVKKVFVAPTATGPGRLVGSLIARCPGVVMIGTVVPTGDKRLQCVIGDLDVNIPVPG